MSTADPQLGSSAGAARAPAGEAPPSGPMSIQAPPRWAWWMLLLAGLCSVVIGVLLLAWPDETLVIIAQIAGIYLLVIGALWIAVGLGLGDARGGGLLRGIIATLAGVIVIRHPSDSLTLMALAIGACLLLVGVIELAGAAESR